MVIIHFFIDIFMDLDPSIHIVMHLVFFLKQHVKKLGACRLRCIIACGAGIYTRSCAKRGLFLDMAQCPGMCWSDLDGYKAWYVVPTLHVCSWS